MNTILPPYLSKGDTVAIISTARKITAQEIHSAVLEMEAWGLVVVLGATIGLSEDQYAGTDAQRVADFQQMLDRPDVKAIWCARGGYGTVRIIDSIDFSKFRKRPKWIIGYSDITVLHAHIHQFHIATLHAAMPIDFHKGTTVAKVTLRKAIFGTHIDAYTVPTTPHCKKGVCTGKLIGGNLSILYSLCGSPSSIDTSGAILCIEDLDEYLYHLDRMLQNLKRNGYFDGLAGLIVGGMTKMHDNAVSYGKCAEEIILDAVKEYDFPVAFNFPMGHVEDNRALIFGAEVVLDVQQDLVQFHHVY